MKIVPAGADVSYVVQNLIPLQTEVWWLDAVKSFQNISKNILKKVFR